MARTSIALFVLLILLVGGIFLQIYLSKRESRWPGLILPGITLIYALLMVLQIAALDGITGMQTALQIIVVFLLGNLPTLVLLGIYLACREKRRPRAQLEKMNIQDLDG